MSSLSLPKSARLSRRSEFADVREKGRSWHGRLMVLGCLASGTKSPARFGVVTSRRTGGAVERTKLRRRLREIFRVHRPSLADGLMMVAVPRRAAVVAPFQALRDEWLALAGRARAFK
ncbi:MAG: ribonuclease P protein component [Chthoniobacterales bacterium]|nr:ribonuclease P protein component [Chthoniobacterales bacterium]